MSSRPSSTAHSHPIAPTVPPSIHHLANPTPTLIDANLPNYLLPELISTLRAGAAYVVQRRIEEEARLREEGLLPPLSSKAKGKLKQTKEQEEAEVRGEVEEEVRARLGRMGRMVGGFIAEKLTIARAPLANHLDIIKFICKDVFLYVYSKQIDNLRTNHRGTFVLQSHAFPPLFSLSSHRGTAADLEAAKTHLIFPQALIQGALSRLGMPAYVTAECTLLPQCTFQIRTVKSTQGTPALSTPAPAPAPSVPSIPAGVAPASGGGGGGVSRDGDAPGPAVPAKEKQVRPDSIQVAQAAQIGMAGLGIGG